MNSAVDEKHGDSLSRHTVIFKTETHQSSTVYRPRGLPWLRHNGGMVAKTNITESLRRVSALFPNARNPTQWAKSSQCGRQTVVDAINGSNATLDTLHKLAQGVGLTLAEMLEYGDHDWENKVAARRLLMEMTPEEVTALRTLLFARKEKERDGKPPPDADASEASG